MKVNKTKSPFAPGGVDAPDEKDVAKAVKGEKFAETLSALEASAATDGASAAPSAARSALTAIASQYDLSDEGERQKALRESAEFLVRSRLSEKYKKADKAIGELSDFVADDPFLKSKLLSVLEKLNNA